MTTFTARNHPSIRAFRREVDSGHAMIRRVREHGFGRNANATLWAIERRYENADRILREASRDDHDPLPEYLDVTPGLAARWETLERYAVGLDH